MAKQRTCPCCGKVYEYCPTCGKDTNKPWLAVTDSLECRELLNIISAYNMNLVSKDKVKDVLDKYNINDFSKYKKSISDKLNELFPKVVIQETETVSDESQNYTKHKSWKKRNKESGYYYGEETSNEE